MRGRWHGVLPELGVPSGFLNGKNQPCPLCGGKDRARFDDKDGTGSYFCNQCGAGDGISLVMKINGWQFKEAAQKIEAVIGSVEPSKPKPKADSEKQRQAMRDVWGAARPIGQAVRRYFLNRGIDPGDISALRESANHEMLALVRDPQGNGCQVHRTLLTPDGHKADVEQVRLFMPGQIPKGAAVRLSPSAERLGIAEGIETALSAAILFDVNCWAALNASLLKHWEPPEEAKSIVVFGDHDANCTGQAAAYELARRISSKFAVSVEIPQRVGVDWNDVLMERARRRNRGFRCVEQQEAIEEGQSHA